MILSTDAAYPQIRRNVVWPQNTPGRYPRLIVQAASQNDVVQAAAMRPQRTGDWKGTQPFRLLAEEKRT